MRPVLHACLAAFWVGAACAGAGELVAAPRTVAVTAIVQHPALDAVLEGLRRGLADAGYTEGRDIAITYESAQGNPAIAAQIAERFVAASPAMIVAISTPSAQAVAAATRTIPVVFSAVTDPLAAGLVASLERPGGNITGVSDVGRMADNVALIREITPNVSRLGVLFNPAEANSVASRAALATAAEAAGIAIVDAPVASPDDVERAARSLVGKVDALFAPNDNTVVQAFEAAAEVANDTKLPLYAADTENVPRGALAALGVDYIEVGLLTAALVHRILSGGAPGDMPVVSAPHAELHLNRGVAAAIGVRFPEPVVERAAKIVE